MAVTLTIARLQEFFRDNRTWPQGYRFEGVKFVARGLEVNNPLDLPDEEEVVVTGGITIISLRGQTGPDFEAHLRAWLENSEA
jgi:hypothetical protein